MAGVRVIFRAARIPRFLRKSTILDYNSGQPFRYIRMAPVRPFSSATQHNATPPRFYKPKSAKIFCRRAGSSLKLPLTHIPAPAPVPVFAQGSGCMPHTFKAFSPACQGSVIGRSAPCWLAALAIRVPCSLWSATGSGMRVPCMRSLYGDWYIAPHPFWYARSLFHAPCPVFCPHPFRAGLA